MIAPVTRASSLPAKLALLGALYFSQGLPFGFFTQALPMLLRRRGFSLGEIGLASLLAIPWALKLAWAPLIDRHSSGRLGRRKSWIVPLQLASVIILAALAVSGAERSISILLGAVLVLNLLAATQDIATDGLAVDTLAASERGLGNGLQVAGYRVGMIIGGGVLLIVHDDLAPGRTFAVMALLLAVATLPIALTRERTTATSGARQQVHFVRRPGALRLLLLIASFKTGDAFATGMLRPFLADSGLGLADIGWLLGTVGFLAGLLGALGGGLLVNRVGRRRALLGFGLLQAAAVAGYACLAFGTPTLLSLYGVCAFEHAAGGMATAALFTCMMDWSSRAQSATDYTTQASAVVVATGVASAAAGFSAQAFGYGAHFLIATALALAGLLLVWHWFPAVSPTDVLHT